MKKIIFIMVALVVMTVTYTSCKEAKKEENPKESHEEHAHDNDDLAHKVYQCPMDCEEGKTYDKEGACPVCKMKLKEKESDSDKDSEHTEEHDEGVSTKHSEGETSEQEHEH